MVLLRSVCGPLRIPLTMHPAVGLLHATPRSDYTRFPTSEEAEAAIREDQRIKGEVAMTSWEIVAVEQHHAEQERLNRGARSA